jgi:putative copper export protein
MKEESLEAAERRWRNKTLYRSKRPSNWSILVWLLLLLVGVLLATLFLLSGDVSLVDSFLRNNGLS